MITLDKKVAIVTGAANGIGRAIAEVFSEEGARVVLADVDGVQGRSVAKSLPGAVFVQADVSVEAQVRAVVEAALALNGHIDVLCNSASFLGPSHASLEASAEEWRRCFAVTLLGAQYFISAVLPHMLLSKAGSIVNISAVQGVRGAKNSVAYTSMKHGLIGLTRSAACDYGSSKIRVNAICPGPIQTQPSGKPEDELDARQIGRTFLGRAGLPREVAYAALFLASDAASYITGAVVPVDGGWTAM